MGSQAARVAKEATVGISPWIKSSHQTQLAPSWTETLVTDSGSTANLTGLSDSALTIYFTNVSNGVETKGTGALHIVQAAGIVSYQVGTNDVLLGMYHVRVWVAFVNGPSVYDLGVWSVEP